MSLFTFETYPAVLAEAAPPIDFAVSAWSRALADSADTSVATPELLAAQTQLL